MVIFPSLPEAFPLAAKVLVKSVPPTGEDPSLFALSKPLTSL